MSEHSAISNGDHPVADHAQQCLTPRQLASRWGKCRQTIFNFIASGTLRTFKVGGSRLIPMAEIERIERGGE